MSEGQPYDGERERGRLGPLLPWRPYLAVIWTMTGIAIITYVIRIYVRLFKGTRRLYWDDATITLALSMNIATSCIWAYLAPIQDWHLNYAAGLRADPPPLEDVKRYLLFIVPIQVFFSSILLSVKVTFLLFFRRLRSHTESKWELVYWWVVLLICITGFTCSLGLLPWKCFTDLFYTIQHCLGEEGLEKQWWVLGLQQSFDIITDFMILLIPIHMVWRLKMPLGKKLALIGLFSLGILTIAISITRITTQSAKLWGHDTVEASNLWFWSSLLCSVAITVACLSSFPRLFQRSKQRDGVPARGPAEPAIAPVAPRSRSHWRTRMGFATSLFRSTNNDNTIQTGKSSGMSSANTAEPEYVPGRPDLHVVMSNQPPPPVWLVPNSPKHTVDISSSREPSLGTPTKEESGDKIAQTMEYNIDYDNDEKHHKKPNDSIV
ncbi:hypothetical protein QBC35DRAFT_546412 [Podospora australis]|uniref:Rhodopsin domain-containing protein n=1 Tax=Podospora australis TaxID=1536484 RepID=A0AAN6WIZ4_9PEZI|nr:hypothetical protein QBC35DRAFT_546412 [Podospora australis]